eukprot:scaffold310358_cov28-Tisochrysis_lutea.AAC.1
MHQDQEDGRIHNGRIHNTPLWEERDAAVVAVPLNKRGGIFHTRGAGSCCLASRGGTRHVQPATPTLLIANDHAKQSPPRYRRWH